MAEHLQKVKWPSPVKATVSFRLSGKPGDYMLFE